MRKLLSSSKWSQLSQLFLLDCANGALWTTKSWSIACSQWEHTREETRLWASTSREFHTQEFFSLKSHSSLSLVLGLYLSMNLVQFHSDRLHRLCLLMCIQDWSYRAQSCLSILLLQWGPRRRWGEFRFVDWSGYGAHPKSRTASKSWNLLSSAHQRWQYSPSSCLCLKSEERLW